MGAARSEAVISRFRTADPTARVRSAAHGPPPRGPPHRRARAPDNGEPDRRNRVTGFDRAPQRNLSDDTLTEHEQKNPSSNHAWPTSPRYLSRRRSTTTRRLDRGRLSTDQRPHNHHSPPASPVAGLGASRSHGASGSSSARRSASASLSSACSRMTHKHSRERSTNS